MLLVNMKMLKPGVQVRERVEQRYHFILSIGISVQAATDGLFVPLFWRVFPVVAESNEATYVPVRYCSLESW